MVSASGPVIVVMLDRILMYILISSINTIHKFPRTKERVWKQCTSASCTYSMYAWTQEYIQVSQKCRGNSLWSKLLTKDKEKLNCYHLDDLSLGGGFLGIRNKALIGCISQSAEMKWQTGETYHKETQQQWKIKLLYTQKYWLLFYFGYNGNQQHVCQI